jgi:hypothetical protein
MTHDCISEPSMAFANRHLDNSADAKSLLSNIYNFSYLVLSLN